MHQTVPTDINKEQTTDGISGKYQLAMITVIQNFIYHGT